MIQVVFGQRIIYAKVVKIIIKTMKEKIQEVREKLNNEICAAMPINNKSTREFIKTRLEEELGDSVLVIKCDEENNSPEIVDMNCAIARVSWLDSCQAKYSNLIFGQDVQVLQLQQKLYL